MSRQNLVFVFSVSVSNSVALTFPTHFESKFKSVLIFQSASDDRKFYITINSAGELKTIGDLKSFIECAFQISTPIGLGDSLNGKLNENSRRVQRKELLMYSSPKFFLFKMKKAKMIRISWGTLFQCKVENSTIRDSGSDTKLEFFKCNFTNCNYANLYSSQVQLDDTRRPIWDLGRKEYACTHGKWSYQSNRKENLAGHVKRRH